MKLPNLKNLLFSLIPLLGILLVFEIICRTLLYFHIVKFPQIDHSTVIHQYAANPKLVYEMKPSFSVKGPGGVAVMTNSLGMRDHEYPKEKREGVFRICIIGDSVAFGMGLENEKTFAKLLEKQLSQVSSRPVEVLNFSVAGYNSVQETIVLKEKVLSFEPDLVIAAICLNDDSYTDGMGKLARALAPFSIGPKSGSKVLTLTLYGLEKNLISKTTNIKRIDDYTRELGAQSRSHHFEVLVAILPYNFKSYEDYAQKEKHLKIQNFAKESALPYIDFLDDWRILSPQERVKLYYHGDDQIHLSEFGMESVSDRLFNYITSDFPIL